MLWKWNEGVEWIWLDGDGWRWQGGLSASCCVFCLFFTLFHPFLYTIGSFLSFFNPPPPPPHHSFKFDSGNVIHLYSFISLFLSPLPLFFNLPSVLSDYCGDGPVKASPITVFEQHCSLALCSADTRLCSICRLYCVCSALLRQNMYHTHATRLYRACIYWRPPKIYFEVIFFFFFPNHESSDWESWNS